MIDVNKEGILIKKTDLEFENEGVLNPAAIREGDSVHLSESPDGYRLSAYDPEFARQMSAAEDIMRRRRNVLRELAK